MSTGLSLVPQHVGRIYLNAASEIWDNRDLCALAQKVPRLGFEDDGRLRTAASMLLYETRKNFEYTSPPPRHHVLCVQGVVRLSDNWWQLFVRKTDAADVHQSPPCFVVWSSTRHAGYFTLKPFDVEYPLLREEEY